MKGDQWLAVGALFIGVVGVAVNALVVDHLIRRSGDSDPLPPEESSRLRRWSLVGWILIGWALLSATFAEVTS